ncbi:PREDICTED: protein-methionine sulfoxide oxidase mical3b isoform X2 [Amphimedon queenslandica]|uniref:Cysteine-rich protein 1 n=1 Tax=Amphimedon queenslandica TaxID=400682 RepID=A0A1X7UA61_AMPQE|nr:PREDICTED: protein-methionine sulfoxide oxidase mical3b isoform X2 [Amphimedon queenslandica]|eukprot:XP_011405685.2 PREDICTED: protein-methionine sulfoxide oxidase mical3b isoform X2 [Amphimedon queenslandica]
MFSVAPFSNPVYHISYSVWARGGGEGGGSDWGTDSVPDSEINSPVLDRILFTTEAGDITPTVNSSSDIEETSLTPIASHRVVRVHSDQDSAIHSITLPYLQPLPPPVSSSKQADTGDSPLQSNSNSPSQSNSNSPSQSNSHSPSQSNSHLPSEETDILLTSSLVLLPEREDHFPTESLDSGLCSTSSLPSTDSSIRRLSGGMAANSPNLPKWRGQAAVADINSFGRPSPQQHSRQGKIANSQRGRCARCGKLVYFAEKRTAMGQQWHQKCFRCTTCGRFLDPGRHCEHEGQPYCNTCYQNQFGPDGLRSGTAIQPRPLLDPPLTAEERSDILSKIETYNLYKENAIETIRHREAGDRIFYEGILRLYWGLKRHIVLSSGANYGRQRARESSYNYISIDDEGFDKMVTQADSGDISKDELQRYMELAQYSLGTDELVKGLSLEAFSNGESATDSGVGTITEESDDPKEEYVIGVDDSEDDSLPEEKSCQSLTNSPTKGRVVLRQKSDVTDRIPRTTSVRRRSASFKKVQKYKRQEAREEKRSKFIPPYGKPTNLRVSNLQRTPEVIDMLLQKYNVENKSSEFSLMVVHDSGAMEQLDPSDSPLAIRLKLGPSEDVAKIYVMEASDSASMQLSQEVAEYIRFQLPELNIFLKKFDEEEQREKEKLRRRFEIWKDAIREVQSL